MQVISWLLEFSVREGSEVGLLGGLRGLWCSCGLPDPARIHTYSDASFSPFGEKSYGACAWVQPSLGKHLSKPS